MTKFVGTLRKNSIEKIGQISIEQMESICPDCAKLMKERGMESIDVEEAVSDWVETKVAGVGGDYPGKMPPQLVRGLCKKFGADPGFFTRCEGSNLHLPAGWDKKAYCAELHKHCVGKWPGEGTHRKQMKVRFVLKR